MSPRMHVKRPFHVIVKHMMATETSAEYLPGNKGLLCGLSTHRTQVFDILRSSFFEDLRRTREKEKPFC